MKPIETGPIICGTDFSKNALEAADVAAALATRLNTSLVLVHAYMRLIHVLIPDVNETPSYLRQCLHLEAERLRALGAIVEENLSEGVPDDVLVRISSQRKARLLVVSSIGFHESTRWFTGSTAVRSAESSPVPTLVVRESAPFEAWARGERALKVFVGTDFGASSDAALRWVAALRELGPCEVIAGHEIWPPDEAARLGLSCHPGLGGDLPTLRSVLERDLPSMKSILERDLREKATRLLGSNDVSVQVDGNWGRADLPIVGMAIDSKADLLVVGTHQRTGFGWLREGSVSRGILTYAPMSVACVPTPAASRMDGPRTRKCLRVLVAVDLEEAHGFAAPYGYSIVNPGGTVRLLHNIVPSFRLSKPAKEEHTQIVAESEAKLRGLAPDETEARGVTTEVEVTETQDSAEAICAAAERFGADIVCIGSHTRPGFTAKVLGSVALAVLQTSRRPVLTVWPPTE